jgi:hypothetical protein
MTLRRITIIIVALWVAVWATLHWEANDLGRLQRLLAERTTRRTETEAQIQATKKRGAAVLETNLALSAAIEKQRADQKAAAKSASDRSGDAPVGNVSAPAASGNVDFRAIVAKDPELRQLYLKGFVADLYTNWGPLFKQLGLSPDQINKLNANQLSLEEKKLDLAALADSEGVSTDDPDIAAQAHQDWRDAGREARKLLGKADFHVYRTYLSNQPVLPQVNDLAAFEFSVADPLNAFQAGQLMQVLADASVRDKNNWVKSGTVNWQTAMPRVQAVLTPGQYEALQIMQAQKAAQLQIKQLTNPQVGTAASHP